MLRSLLRSHAVYLILGICFIGVVVVQWVDSLGGPPAVWARFGLWAPLCTVPLHAVVAITPLPSDVMSIANGTVYGFWWGSVLSWVGWFAASFIQYGLGRRFQADFDVAGWLDRAPRRLRQFPLDHPVFLIVGRFVPYAGGHLVTLLPGALNVDLRRFAWCTAVALVPQSMVMAGVGAGLLLL